VKIAFVTYQPGEHIPVASCLQNKKLAKFFNRETSAAIVCMDNLLGKSPLAPETPFYYATGWIEYEDYGLREIAEDSAAEDGKFSDEIFIKKGLSRISPLNQFKVLQNMPLSFVSIVYGLKGDNAVIYGSGGSLLKHAVYSPFEGEMLIGAGKAYRSGLVEAGFALVAKTRIQDSTFLFHEGEAVDIFRTWAQGGGS
jgi:hypothetical protein